MSKDGNDRGRGKRPPRQSDDDLDLVVEKGFVFDRLPDGVYEVQCVNVVISQVKRFNASRAFMHFEVVEPGPYMGKRILGAWSVKRTVSRGVTRTSVSRGGELYRIICKLQGFKVRPDRVSLKFFRNIVVRVQTRTVDKDSRQRTHAACNTYSRVEDILEVVAGAPESG